VLRTHDRSQRKQDQRVTISTYTKAGTWPIGERPLNICGSNAAILTGLGSESKPRAFITRTSEQGGSDSKEMQVGDERQEVRKVQ
jgi:hypothetical protein